MIVRQGWRISCLVLGCLVVFLIVLYKSTFGDIVALWKTSTFSHGFLIVPTSLYLTWTRRHRLAQLIPATNFWALAVLATSAFIWFLGKLTETSVLEQFCVIAMLVTVIWGVVGDVATRTLGLPIAFLFFAVPLGAGLVPKLQDFSAWFAVKMLDLTGVPALLEGRLISVPSGNWEVAEACSGIRYLTASVAVGFVFAGLAYRTWVRRGGFLFASAVLPVVANGFRVYFIVLLAYLSNNRLAAGVDHILYGWLFFTIVMLFLLSIGAWSREKPNEHSDAAPFAPAAEVLNEVPPDAVRPFSMKRSGAFAFLGVAIMGVAPIADRLLWDENDRATQTKLALPMVAGPWQVTDSDLYGWRPVFSRPNHELFQAYESRAGIVKVYLASYNPRAGDVKLVSTTNMLFDHKIWSRTVDEEKRFGVGAESFDVHETFVRSSRRALVVWNWYCVGGASSSNEVLAKARWTRARLLRDHRPAMAIVIATEIVSNAGQAAEVLRDFTSQFLSVFQCARE